MKEISKKREKVKKKREKNNQSDGSKFVCSFFSSKREKRKTIRYSFVFNKKEKNVLSVWASIVLGKMMKIIGEQLPKFEGKKEENNGKKESKNMNYTYIVLKL